MKLELKHLAPYLPYGLRLQDDESNNGKLVALFEDCLNIRYDINVGDYEFGFYDIKPILRPLSDLPTIFKEFVDVMPFGNEYKGQLYFEEKTLSKLTDLFIIKSDVAVELSINKAQPLTSYYLAVDVMIKNHFDVFGLIDQNLAIDINTLK